MTEKKSKKWKQFNVAGVTFKNPGMGMTRLEWISKYVVYGSKFELKREPDNIYDENAIKVMHVMAKSGKKMMIGYVPKKVTADLAPLLDRGWKPTVRFGRAYIVEKKTPGKNIGDCIGLALRYPLE